MRRIVLFSSLVAFVAAGFATATPASAVPPNPIVYAHRGGAGYAPENTLAAFRKTQDLFGERGVWLEMDTQATRDNVLVLMHDDTVNRTTDCTGAVNARTYAQLAGCNAAADYPGGWPEVVAIPKLEDVLIEGRDNGWKLMIEIKDIPGEANFDPLGTMVATLLVRLVRQVGFPVKNLIVQSFWPLVLDAVKRLDPRVATSLLTSSTLPSAPSGVGIPAATNVIYATVLGYTISSPDARTVDFSKATVALAHTLGRKLVVWTVNDTASLLKMRRWRTDGVITDRPDVAYAAYG